MSHHIKGQPRHQSTLFPESIDDFVTEDNPVRVIDMFVDHLDLLDLGFETVNPKLTGRPGYHPSTMLKLYIYGYLNRIQSSRMLSVFNMDVWINILPQRSTWGVIYAQTPI